MKILIECDENYIWTNSNVSKAGDLVTFESSSHGIMLDKPTSLIDLKRMLG